MLIARALVRHFSEADVLLITGAKEVTQFVGVARTDYLTLPSLAKDLRGRYSGRDLALPLKELSKLRGRTIRAALKVFRPDLLIVDNVPMGANGELKSALKGLRKSGRTRIVLGLRDILDAPERTRRQWLELDNETTIRRFFDAVWVYGQQAVFDQARAYGFAAPTARRLSYLGYFDQRGRLDSPHPFTPGMNDRPPREPYVLCQVGGGQDGQHLAETFVRTRLPRALKGILICGPYMPVAVRERLQAQARQRSDLRVVGFVEEPTQLLAGAERVISMGGYNSVGEALSFRKPLLVVPRVRPRLEQLVRAECLQTLGLLDMVHPDALSPRTLEGWLRQEPSTPDGVRHHLDLGGLDALVDEVGRLLRRPPGEAIHVAA